MKKLTSHIPWALYYWVIVTVISLSNLAEAAETDGEYLKIPALGRTADLGYLFDARTESFREFIFKEPLKNEFVDITQTPNTFTQYSYASSISDKSNLFDIKAEVTASILFGLFTVHGSAQYLTSSKKSARQTEGALLYKARREVQNLQIYYEGLKGAYNNELINSTEATHVVTGVEWGANVAISFVDKFYEDRSKENATGHLSIAFDKLKALFSVTGSADVKFGSQDDKEVAEFSMKIYGDVNLPSEFPQNFKQIQDLIKKVPEAIQNSNGGKGVPLAYSLTPISELRKLLKLSAQQSAFISRLDEASNQDFIKVFDEITEMEQRVNDLYEDVTSNSICVLETTRSRLNDLRNKFQKVKLSLKEEMKATLLRVRSGHGEVTDLVSVIDRYQTNNYNVQGMEMELLGFKEAIEKIKLYKTLTKSYPGLTYIGRRGNLKTLLFERETVGKVVYVLFMKPEFTRKDPGAWTDNNSAFLSTLNKPFNRLVVIDCDFNSEECNGIQNTVIKQFFNGKVTTEDVVKEFQKRKSMDLKPLEFKAIGRTAALGELYDARSDSFLGANVLRSGYPTSIINPMRNDHSEVNVVPYEIFTEKTKAMGVTSDLQFSILANLFPLQQSGKYLLDQFESDGDCNSKSVFFSQHLDSEEIKVKVSDSKFQDFAAIDLIMKVPATHFVTKIEYGFNTVFSLGPSNNNADCNLKSANVEGSARKLKEALYRATSASAQKRANDSGTDIVPPDDLSGIDSTLRIKIFSDIQGKDSNAETINGGELGQYLNRKFFLQQAMQIKGMPVSYVLYPIDNLRAAYGVLRPFEVPFKSMEEIAPNLPPTKYAVIIEKIEKAKNKISRITAQVQENQNCVTDTEFSMLAEIRREFKLNFGNFSTEFRELVLQVKAGLVGRESLEYFGNKSDTMEADKFGKDGHYLGLDKLSSLETKLQLCIRVKSHADLQYIGRDSSTLDQLFTGGPRSESSKTYLLYYKPSWVNQNKALWLSKSQRFFQTLSSNASSNHDGNDENRRFIVDCDFNHVQCEHVTEPTIYEYRHGSFVADSGTNSGLNYDLYEILKTRLGKIETSFETLKTRAGNTTKG